MSPFLSAVHLFPTVESVVEYNINYLHSLNKRIAFIKAQHTGNNASKASSDDAGGLEPIVHLVNSSRVMLTANLWVEAVMGLLVT